MSPPGANLTRMAHSSALTTAALGLLGEDLAASFLLQQGWAIVERNWRCRAGEIDLIAIDQHVLVVIEVKTRRTSRFGSPIEAITDEKALRLRRLAGLWLSQHEHPPITSIRIDAIGVLLHSDGLCSIDHRRNVA